MYRTRRQSEEENEEEVGGAPELSHKGYAAVYSIVVLATDDNFNARDRIRVSVDCPLGTLKPNAMPVTMSVLNGDGGGDMSSLETWVNRAVRHRVRTGRDSFSVGQ